jgi:hypothetical protein
VVAEMRGPTTPPPPAPAIVVEEGEAPTEATVTQAALEAPSEAGPSVEGVVVVLDEDSAPPQASESHDAAAVPVLEPAQVPAAMSLLLAVEVPVPPPTVEVQGPPPTAEAVEYSSARVSFMVEEMMDLKTCRYIDFPGVGVIDLEAPQLPEKEYAAAVERRSNMPMIMETIVSVSKVLQEYEHASGFASAAATDAEDVALATPAARVEPTEDVSAPPHVDEGQEASPPRPVEAVKTPAPVTNPVSTKVFVGGKGTYPPGPVAVEVDGVEARVLDESSTVAQESAVPETVAKATTRRSRWSRRRGRPFHKAQRVARPGRLSSRVLRGQLPPGLMPTPRMTRRPRCATLWSVG